MSVTGPPTQQPASVVRPSSDNALPVGTHVADFEITGIVGEGGFGIVYEAFDHSLQRRVALKEYMPSALANRRGDYTVAVRSQAHEPTFRAGLRSFVNEARLLAQFDHPALVKVFRFWEQNATAYMVMPLYEGRTLKEVLRENPRPDEGWLRAIIAPLLDALEVMHAAQCYHRDVAPDNILILKNGAPLLLDFGAARRIIGDMTQAVTVILKPGYAPIEQYADDASMQQGPWTDIYALSAVFCLAVTGKPPSTSVTRMVSDPMKPLADTVEGYSREFLAALDRGLAVRPEQRPQSIAEFRQLLGIRTWAPPVTQIRVPAGAASVPPRADDDRTAKLAETGPGPGGTAAPPAPPTAPASVPRSAPGDRSTSGQPATTGAAAPPSRPSGTRTGGSATAVPSKAKPDVEDTVTFRGGPAGAPVQEAAHGRGLLASRGLLAVAAVALAIAAAVIYALLGGGPSPPQEAKREPPPDRITAQAPVSPPAVAPAVVAPPAAPPGAAPGAAPAATEAAPAPVKPAPADTGAASTPSVATPAPPVTVPASAEPPPASPPAAGVAAGTRPAEADKGAGAGSADKVATGGAPEAAPPPKGRINLAIKPWGGIYVNGQPQGVTPPKKWLELPEGKYNIEIRNTGFPSHFRDVEVRAGKPVTISHTFQ